MHSRTLQRPVLRLPWIDKRRTVLGLPAVGVSEGEPTERWRRAIRLANFVARNT